MNNDYIILPDEYPAHESDIQRFERQRDIRFPLDYRQFLLEYNGGVVMPCEPVAEGLSTYIFPIERFYSIQDIVLGVIYNQREIQIHINEDITDFNHDVNPQKLIFIGICERGNILLNCGKKGNGEVYYSNYSGGEGLEKTGLESFAALLESLSWTDEEYAFDRNDPRYANWQSDKVFTFDYSFYWEDDVKQQSLERFKEVLTFYGSPNTVHKRMERDVVQHYINYPVVLKYLLDSGAEIPRNLGRVYNLESLQYLVARGTDVEGLLNKTNNIEVIRFLIEQCGQDINLPYSGVYPLLHFTRVENVFSNHSRTVQYHLIEDILALDCQLDLKLKDDQGRTVEDRIQLIKEKYDKIVEKSPYLKRQTPAIEKPGFVEKSSKSISWMGRILRFFRS